MEFIQIEKLHIMKRVELQKLCKSFGIKANMKTTKLINALIQCGESQLDNTAMPVDSVRVNESEPSTEGCEITKDKVVDKMATNTKKETLTLPHAEDIKNLEIKGEKVELVAENTENPSKVPSKIPRLTVLKVTKTATVTPSSSPSDIIIKNKAQQRTKPKDWSKIHQRQFEKMDSLDVYLIKKRKRAEDLSTSDSVKKVKISIQEDEVKKTEKAQSSSSCKSSDTPKPAKKKVEFGRKSLAYCNTPKTKENTVTPGRRATFGVTKLPTDSVRKPSTPFRFSAAQNTMFSPTPRQTFDIKASLAKPLSYKPYTGKLQKMSTSVKKNESKVTSVKKLKTHECNVKEVKITSRQERREKQTKKQSKRRAEGVGKRRGIVR